MCRHIAYLGPPVALRELLVEPPHALYRQSWAPRMQAYGTVNADGFGVGWYAPDDPLPARYRRTGPIWADPSLRDLARVVRSGALLAAVRDTTDGSAPDESAAAPYASGRWLFSHNGAVTGWPHSVADLAGALPPEELLAIEARCDAALVWALVLHRLRAGDALGQALAEVVTDIAVRTPARLNLLLTDGRAVAATTWGDSLWYRTGRDARRRAEPAGATAGAVAVASEPYDDDPFWTEVPDRSLFLAVREGPEVTVDVTALKEPTA